MKDEKKYTAKRHAELALRGLKLIASFPKPYLLASGLNSVADAAVPFINIYFSARILNELAGGREPGRFVTLVLLTVGLNALGALCKAALNRWTEYCESMNWRNVYFLYNNKLLTMDFIDLENPDIRRDYEELRGHHNGMGFGLMRLRAAYQQIINGGIKIALSITLAFSLFTFRTPAGAGFEYLDSPAAVAVVLLILSGSVFLAPYISLVGGRIFAKHSDHNNMANRVFGFYYFQMPDDTGRAKDIRIYDQLRIIFKGAKAFDNDTWLGFSKYAGRYNALGTAVTRLSNGLIYLFVALKAFAGAFGVGSIVQYVGAVTQFGGGFAAVLSGVGDLMNNTVFMERVVNFLDIPNKKYQGTLSVEKRDDNEYDIEFKNVSFKYPGDEQPPEAAVGPASDAEGYALKNLNLKFTVGRRMAVVGMNGSGKTTMIKLLCRLYDPTEGVITLNGIDIKKYNYDEYMALFGVVFQDFKLLPFTLGQNVAAGVDFDAEQAARALAKVGFGERLAELPKGLDTFLYKNFEEDGVEVSGGEAQKIALARALYKDAPFIVLDEPTAALDPVAEYEIYSKFNEIVGGKTAIYISHRLSSCRFCDDIAVFHGGRLVQRGSHAALLADGRGKYYELWNAQAQYYTD